MLLFTSAISLSLAVAVGLVAVVAVRETERTALKEGGRGQRRTRRGSRTRNTLAVAQIAMALVLLIVSGLMIRTFVAMRQVEPGFVRPEEVQTFRVAIPDELHR